MQPRLMAIPVIAFVLDGCAQQTALTFAPGARIDPAASITILRPTTDPANIYGRLEHRLVASGFRVMSIDASSTRLEGEARTAADSTSTRTTASAGIVQHVRSDLALRFGYSTRAAIASSDVFETFSATIIDVKSGAVIASGNFSQGSMTGKSINQVLAEFVEGLLARR